MRKMEDCKLVNRKKLWTIIEKVNGNFECEDRIRKMMGIHKEQ